MPAPPSTDNYEVGGITAIIGGLDLGNVAGFNMDPSGVTVLQHFTARSGARKVDKQVVTMRFTLDEHQEDLYRLFFMGGGTTTSVTPLLNPLAETNIYIVFKNEAGNIWTFSAPRVTVRPASAMDMRDFSDWVPFELEAEILENTGTPTAPFGTFTFV